MDSTEPSKPPSRHPALTSLVTAALWTIFLALPALSLPPPNTPAGSADRLDVVPRVDNILSFEPADAVDLVRVLDGLWDEGGLDILVPNVAPSSFPPGLRRLAVSARKRAFFRSVLPYVLKANQWIADDRAELLSLFERASAGQSLGKFEWLFLRDLATRYRIDEEVELRPGVDLVEPIRKLLNRVDVIPPSLALAQAALETGWGSSRFLREGNALFGQWVFSARKGMVPAARPRGANSSVARFDRLGEAVAAYMHNLNTFWAYHEFREIRARLRRAGQDLDGQELAGGLLLYAETRERYVRDIRCLIRVNRLARFDETRLGRVEPGRLTQILSADERLSARKRKTPTRPDV